MFLGVWQFSEIAAVTKTTSSSEKENHHHGKEEGLKGYIMGKVS